MKKTTNSLIAIALAGVVAACTTSPSKKESYASKEGKEYIVKYLISGAIC